MKHLGRSLDPRLFCLEHLQNMRQQHQLHLPRVHLGVQLLASSYFEIRRPRTLMSASNSGAQEACQRLWRRHAIRSRFLAAPLPKGCTLCLNRSPAQWLIEGEGGSWAQDVNLYPLHNGLSLKVSTSLISGGNLEIPFSQHIPAPKMFVAGSGEPS